MRSPLVIIDGLIGLLGVCTAGALVVFRLPPCAISLHTLYTAIALVILSHGLLRDVAMIVVRRRRCGCTGPATPVICLESVIGVGLLILAGVQHLMGVTATWSLSVSILVFVGSLMWMVGWCLHDVTIEVRASVDATTTRVGWVRSNPTGSPAPQ